YGDQKWKDFHNVAMGGRGCAAHPPRLPTVSGCPPARRRSPGRHRGSALVTRWRQRRRRRSRRKATKREGQCEGWGGYAWGFSLFRRWPGLAASRNKPYAQTAAAIIRRFGEGLLSPAE